MFTCTVWLLFHNLLDREKAGGERVRLKLDVQGQRGGNILDVDGYRNIGDGESCKLDNFQCIVPYKTFLANVRLRFLHLKHNLAM